MANNAIIFSNIPGSGLTAPIQAFEVNSGGQYQATTRLILQGHTTAAGTLVNGAAPVPVASQNDADKFAGPGSMLREMFRIATRQAPAQPIFLQALADPGTPLRVVTATISASNLVPGQGVLKIMNRTVAVPVGATDTPATIAAALVAAVNSFYDQLTNEMLPCTASQGSTGHTGDVILTMRHAGAIMNDVQVWVPAYANNVFAAAGVVTVVETTTGTGTPLSVGTSLAALGDDPADYVVSPFSDTTSYAAAVACFGDLSGRWSWARQSYGHYFAPVTGSYSALNTLGLTLNDRHETLLRRFSGSLSPSWEWAAGIVARVTPWLSDCVTGNVSRNQTGLRVEGVYGPIDRTILDGYLARNALNNAAISTVTVDPFDGTVRIDKIVTTYRFGTSGQPDTVFRDIQAIFQASGGLSYIRAVLAQEQGQKAFANDNPGGLGAISTPSDIKASFVHAYTDLCAQGVFQNADTFARLIQVKANVQNPARCDVYMPVDRVNPLDILAVNATFYQQYPQAA